jgi:NAD(P)-dependent dehydrogenase (short-subunit alcohol dehydrogenase family)
MTGRVLITGIHTGIGHALAAELLDTGAEVWAVSRTAPEDLAQHQRLQFVSLDLRRFDDIAPALDTLLDGVDSLDLAILNAGVLGDLKDLRDTSIDELRRVMDLNVWANKVVIDALLAKRQVKQVVAISSGAAFNGSGGWGAYSISKSALNLLVRVYAHEHPQTHFSALAPGVIETSMIHAILAQPDNPRHGANIRIRAANAEGRILSPATAARRLVACFPELLERESGSYADIRKLC